MGRKGKKTKHSAKELEAKAAASLTNKGGGKAGLADRKGGAAGHSKVRAAAGQGRRWRGPAWGPPPHGALKWPAPEFGHHPPRRRGADPGRTPVPRERTVPVPDLHAECPFIEVHGGETAAPPSTLIRRVTAREGTLAHNPDAADGRRQRCTSTGSTRS